MFQTKNSDNDRIYQEYYHKVFQYLINRLGNQQDAEDLAQTVFVKVYGKIDTFDESKSSLSTWIFNITRNTLIDHHRAMGYRNHEEIPEVLQDGGTDILEGIILEEEQEILAKAMESLSVEERDLIILHYYKEYTMVKIAELMNRPYGQIKRLHVKALQKLKLCMGA